MNEEALREDARKRRRSEGEEWRKKFAAAPGIKKLKIIFGDEEGVDRPVQNRCHGTLRKRKRRQVKASRRANRR